MFFFCSTSRFKLLLSFSFCANLPESFAQEFFLFWLGKEFALPSAPRFAIVFSHVHRTVLHQTHISIYINSGSLFCNLLFFFAVQCGVVHWTHANEVTDSQNEMEKNQTRAKTWFWVNGSDDVWKFHALPDGTANKLLKGNSGQTINAL